MHVKVPAAFTVLVLLVGCSKDSGDPSSTSANAGDGSHAAPAPAPKFTADQAKLGQALHAKIFDKYPDVDPYYRKPTLWGIMTEPLAVIVVPAPDWKALSKDDRHLLSAYSASLVDAVRSSPFDFMGVPESSPLAPDMRKRAATMTTRSWGIMTGEIGEGGRDVMSEEVVVKGQ